MVEGAIVVQLTHHVLALWTLSLLSLLFLARSLARLLSLLLPPPAHSTHIPILLSGKAGRHWPRLPTCDPHEHAWVNRIVMAILSFGWLLYCEQGDNITFIMANPDMTLTRVSTGEKLRYNKKGINNDHQQTKTFN